MLRTCTGCSFTPSYMKMKLISAIPCWSRFTNVMIYQTCRTTVVHHTLPRQGPNNAGYLICITVYFCGIQPATVYSVYPRVYQIKLGYTTEKEYRDQRYWTVIVLTSHVRSDLGLFLCKLYIHLNSISVLGVLHNVLYTLSIQTRFSKNVRLC